MTNVHNIQRQLTASPDVIPCFIAEHWDVRCAGLHFIVKTWECMKTDDQDGHQSAKIPLIELEALESKWIQKTSLRQNP